jgi:CHAT domain-containing protein
MRPATKIHTRQSKFRKKPPQCFLGNPNAGLRQVGFYLPKGIANLGDLWVITGMEKIRAILLGWVLTVLICGQAAAQPLYRPAFHDIAQADQFQRKFIANLQYGVRPASRTLIRSLMESTGQDADPSLHIYFSLHAADLCLRMNRPQESFDVVQYLLRRFEIGRLPRPQRADLLSALGDIAFELGGKDKRKCALKAYQAAARLLPAEGLQAAVLRRKQGNTLRLLDDLEAAEAAFDAAIRNLAHLARRPDLQGDAILTDEVLRQLLRSYQARAIYHFKRAEDGERPIALAIADFDSARQLIYDPRSDSWGQDKITQYFYEGEIQHDFFKDKDKAMRHYLDAVSTEWECYSYLLSYTYGRIGGLFYDELDFEQARKWYDRQVRYYEAYGEDLERILKVYELLGNVYFVMNDLRQAERYFQIGYKRIAQSKPKNVSSYYFNYGLCLVEMGEYARARTLLQSALELLQASGPPDSSRIANCYLNIGITDLKEHKFRASLSSLLSARRYFGDRLSNDRQRLSLVYCCLNMAYDGAGVADTARIYFDSVMTLVRVVPGNSISVTQAALEAGNYLVKIGEPRAAIALLHREMQRLVNGFNNPNERALPDFNNARSPWHILSVTQSKAYAFWRLYEQECDLKDLQASLEHYMATIRLVRKFRLERNNLDSKLQMVGEIRPAFEKGIRVASDMYLHTGSIAARDSAFKICEQSKSMILMEALLASRADSSSGIPDASLRKKTQLEEEISRLQSALMRASPGRAADQINDRLFRAQNQLRQLTDQLQLLNPRFFGKLYEAGKTDIPRLQERMRKDSAAVIEYMLTEDLLYTFVITGERFQFLRTTLPPLFRCQLRELGDRVRYAETVHDDAYEYCTVAKAVYDVVLGSIPFRLPRRLIIIPDGDLNYLPFDALVDRPCDTGSRNYGDLHYLMESRIFSYNYSSSYLLQEQAKPLTHAARVLVVAPSFDGHPQLPDLQSAREGVIALGEAYDHTDILLDDAATAANFQAKAAEYDIIDLATHAIVDSSDPMKSRLYFTKDSTRGWMYQQEIFTMKLKARLAVLGACETGNGNLSQGEGVMSLARGFSYADVKSILMSLWFVSDAQSKSILEQFYASLADGHPVDEALAIAKRHYLDDLRMQGGRALRDCHPSYWAEFVLVGDYAPVPLARKTHENSISLVAALGFIAAMLGVMWWLFGKNRGRRKP